MQVKSRYSEKKNLNYSCKHNYEKKKSEFRDKKSQLSITFFLFLGRNKFPFLLVSGTLL